MTNKIDMCGGEGCSSLDGLEEIRSETSRQLNEALNERDAFDARCGVLSMQVDDLSRTVAAMGEVAREAHVLLVDIDLNAGLSDGALRIVDRIDAILSRPDVTAERGRWVSHEVYENVKATWQRRLADLAAERDAAIARAESVANVARVTAAQCDAAERAHDALGIQFAAQGERLRLAMACIEKAAKVQMFDGEEFQDYLEARAALDAVPGDALAPTLKVEAGPGFEVHRAIHATWAMNADETALANALVSGRYARMNEAVRARDAAPKKDGE